jgi:hypothetical protein
MPSLLRVTTATMEARTVDMTWNCSCPESGHMLVVIHLVLPLDDDHELYFTPAWDDITLDLTRHNSPLCTFFTLRERIPMPQFIVLMWHGGHYERIGFFNEALSEVRQVWRTKHGEW